MALGLSSSAAVNVLNGEFNLLAAFTKPAGWYVQFHVNGDPGAAGTSRLSVNPNRYAATFGGTTTSGTTGRIANLSAVTFTPPATERYSNFSLWTAASGGTFLVSGTVSNGAVTAGTSASIAIGALTITVNLAA